MTGINKTYVLLLVAALVWSAIVFQIFRYYYPSPPEKHTVSVEKYNPKER